MHLNHYFGICSYKSMFSELDGWIGRRMRAILLIQWKTPKNRQKNFRHFGNGLSKGMIWDMLGGTSYKNHVWRISKSPSIHFILTNSKLQENTGMYYMTDDWTMVQVRFSRSPQRTVRWVPWDVGRALFLNSECLSRTR